MKIYIYAEADNLEEIAEPLADDIAAWIKKKGGPAEMVNDRHEPELSSGGTDSEK